MQILRIEVTVIYMIFHKHYRRVEYNDGSRDQQFSVFIYNFAAFVDILKTVNHRYIYFIYQIDNRDAGRSNLNKIGQSIKESNHHYKKQEFN